MENTFCIESKDWLHFEIGCCLSMVNKPSLWLYQRYYFKNEHWTHLWSLKYRSSIIADFEIGCYVIFSNLRYLWLSQLQLHSPISTRRKMRRKKRPPETPYTMAEVMEMDTESTIFQDHIYHVGIDSRHNYLNWASMVWLLSLFI